MARLFLSFILATIILPGWAELDTWESVIDSMDCLDLMNQYHAAIGRSEAESDGYLKLIHILSANESKGEAVSCSTAKVLRETRKELHSATEVILQLQDRVSKLETKSKAKK